jgi:hypothetical protein
VTSGFLVGHALRSEARYSKLMKCPHIGDDLKKRAMALEVMAQLEA